MAAAFDWRAGETYDREVFLRETLDERFARRGAYYFPDGELDWNITAGARYVPDLPERDDPDAWQAGDEFFVPCLDSDGLVLAVLSLIPAQRRVMWALVSERRLEELVQMLEWDGTVKPTARVVCGGVSFAASISPSSVTRSTRSLRWSMSKMPRPRRMSW